MSSDLCVLFFFLFFWSPKEVGLLSLHGTGQESLRFNSTCSDKICIYLKIVFFENTHKKKKLSGKALCMSHIVVRACVLVWLCLCVCVSVCLCVCGCVCLYGWGGWQRRQHNIHDLNLVLEFSQFVFCFSAFLASASWALFNIPHGCAAPNARCCSGQGLPFTGVPGVWQARTHWNPLCSQIHWKSTCGSAIHGKPLRRNAAANLAVCAKWLVDALSSVGLVYVATAVGVCLSGWRGGWRTTETRWSSFGLSRNSLWGGSLLMLFISRNLNAIWHLLNKCVLSKSANTWMEQHVLWAVNKS